MKCGAPDPRHCCKEIRSVYILLKLNISQTHHRPGQFAEVFELVAVLQRHEPVPGRAGAAAFRGLLLAGASDGFPISLRPLCELLSGRVHDAALPSVPTPPDAPRARTIAAPRGVGGAGGGSVLAPLLFRPRGLKFKQPSSTTARAPH